MNDIVMMVYKQVKITIKNVLKKTKVYMVINNFFQFQRPSLSLVCNINIDYTKKQPRILISYISDPLRNLRAENGHTNFLEVLQIIHFYISKGFIIDITNANDTGVLSYIKNTKYDFIFGFGEVFFFMTKKNPNVNNCIYVTENAPDFSSEKESERIKYFYERHGRKVSYLRTGVFFKNEHFKFANNAIVMGIESYFKKFNFNKLLTINPTGHRNTNFTEVYTISERMKKSFLWFGSTGAVHKGLDILIDVVQRNHDFELHICGLREKYLCKNMMQKYKNIYNHGFIDINSQKFIDIIKLVAFMILPSCSEAMSTAVLTVARHGVLPLLLRNVGMDRLTDHVFWLDDFKVEYIEKKMREVSKLDSDFLLQKSHALQKYADKEFCLTTFSENFKKCMDEIL